MWEAIKRALARFSDKYPTRWWWPVIRIYGGPDGSASRTCYMTRVLLGPRTVWGRLYLHIFHREDIDRDPHDHPFDFWTFPINQAYWEDVFVHDNSGAGCFRMVRVSAWRWHKRACTHTHRVVRTETGRWPLVTLVWRGPTKRQWGFWCHAPGWANSAHRYLVKWQDYVYDGLWANVDGADVECPGGVKR